jgi:hypothetical protein
MTEARRRGITLSRAAPGRLACEGPKGSLTPDLVAALRQDKRMVLWLLSAEDFAAARGGGEP